MGIARPIKLPSTNSLLRETVLRLIGKTGPDDAPAGGIVVNDPDTTGCAETSTGVADVEELSEILVEAEVMDVVEPLVIMEVLDVVEELVIIEVVEVTESLDIMVVLDVAIS